MGVLVDSIGRGVWLLYRGMRYFKFVWIVLGSKGTEMMDRTKWVLRLTK